MKNDEMIQCPACRKFFHPDDGHDCGDDEGYQAMRVRDKKFKKTLMREKKSG